MSETADELLTHLRAAIAASGLDDDAVADVLDELLAEYRDDDDDGG